MQPVVYSYYIQLYSSLSCHLQCSNCHGFRCILPYHATYSAVTVMDSDVFFLIMQPLVQLLLQIQMYSSLSCHLQCSNRYRFRCILPCHATFSAATAIDSDVFFLIMQPLVQLLLQIQMYSSLSCNLQCSYCY